jgi:hypothetical protein
MNRMFCNILQSTEVSGCSRKYIFVKRAPDAIPRVSYTNLVNPQTTLYVHRFVGDYLGLCKIWGQNATKLNTKMGEAQVVSAFTWIYKTCTQLSRQHNATSVVICPVSILHYMPK